MCSDISKLPPPIKTNFRPLEYLVLYSIKYLIRVSTFFPLSFLPAYSMKGSVILYLSIKTKELI